MSKHKHFHDCKSPAKMLRYGRQNAIGPLYHWTPKKKAAVNAANIDDGKADQKTNKTN